MKGVDPRNMRFAASFMLALSSVEVSSCGPAQAQILPEAASESPSVIEITPKTFLSKQLVEQFAKITATNIVSIPNEPMALQAYIVGQCGWLDPVILSEIARLNGIARLTPEAMASFEGKTIEMPSCTRLSPASALLNRVSGSAKAPIDLIPTVSGSRTLDFPLLEAAFRSARDEIKSTTGIEQKKIVIPQYPHLNELSVGIANMILAGGITERDVDTRREELFWSNVTRLAFNVFSDKQVAIDVLRDAELKSVTTIRLRPSLNLPLSRNNTQVNVGTSYTTLGTGELEAVKLLDPKQLNVSAPVPAHIFPVDTPVQCDMPAGQSAKWPIAMERVLDALLLNAYERERRGRVSSASIVLVADTGFPIDAFTNVNSGTRSENVIEPRLFFTHQDFFENEEEKGQETELNDFDGDEFRGNILGISLQNYDGNVNPAPSYKYRDHGMSVASLVIGGMHLNRYRMLRTLPIRLHFANLMNDSQPDRVQLSQNELGSLVLYARRHRIDVANLSFSSTQPMQSLEMQLQGATETIFIVAAGNEGKSLDVHKRYPANLGGGAGEFNRIVITVGAHGPDGAITSFSNFSNNFVDILAPGCSIPVPTLDYTNDRPVIKIDYQSGTSFSAPIVSFVAALLRSEGVRVQDIKRRIVLTASHDSKLKTKVRFGARLDIPNALSVYNDVIILRTSSGADGERLRGRLNQRQTINLPEDCGGSTTIRRVARLDQIGLPGEFRIFAHNEGSIPEPKACKLADEGEQTLSFYDIDALLEKSVKLSDVGILLTRER
ncbi:S8 family serine peptidase [Prosthecomicrobium sp. N25]|uniref:S8 family serine peptidase n=1 Tax=Prosthecomicrobium sp. N25 TaxID=3129254 RepID=UPI003077D381